VRDRQRILRSIGAALVDDVRPLTGLQNAWHLRLGDWRVLFELQRESRRMEVTAVWPPGHEPIPCNCGVDPARRIRDPRLAEVEEAC
jgi:hypothetical protein